MDLTVKFYWKEEKDVEGHDVHVLYGDRAYFMRGFAWVHVGHDDYSQLTNKWWPNIIDFERSGEVICSRESSA
jgi:hypothetical protein